MRSFLTGLALGILVLCASYALASRNSSGTMAAANGPYISGTVISSSVINARLADIENELTASLERSGKGPMLAPLRLTNGTNALPSLTFDSDTDTGLYRIGANNLGVAIGGVKFIDWTAGTETVTVAGAASSTVAQWLQASLSDGNSVTHYIGKDFSAGGAGIAAYTKNATAANSTFCLGVFGGGASTLCVDGNNKTIIGGGTGITASFNASASLTPAAVGANLCANFTDITVTGAVVGSPCMVGPPAGGPNGVSLTCFISATNKCTIQACNGTTGSVTPTSGTYKCLVFNL